MTPQEFEALLDQVAPLPSTPGAAAPAQSSFSPEQIAEIDKLIRTPKAVAPQPTRAHTPEEIAAANALFDDLASAPAAATPAPSRAFSPQDVIPHAEPHGPMHPAATDIATGLGELPGAIASGARNAAQESLKFAVDAGNFVGSGMDRVVSAFGGAIGQDIKAPELPAFGTKPKTVTGAVDAWQRGDSALAPHATENFRASLNAATVAFKQHDGLPSLLHNVFLVPSMKIIGAPARLLGAMDEAVKTMVYRSKVQARAFVEAEERGLAGADASEFIAKRLDDAFDDAGRATDGAALDEAKIATFSQELLPGTVGKTIQDGLARHPAGRLVLPFLRTPLNALRYGVKLTPGLNLAQQEYRAMLTGRMGPEATAQAIGQMSLGSLYLALGAWAASSGRLTGGGPSEPKAKAALLATGWQPYSVVTANADGSKTYFNLGRLDPIAMPFGVVADIVDALSQTDPDDTIPDQINEAMSAALIGIVKQLGQKSYLKGAADFVEALSEPDGNLPKAGGQLAANFVPMSSALRFVNPDNTMKDARDLTDRLMAIVPGLSEKVPARRDMFGDPITVHKGLWRDGDKGMVDAEIRRMAHEEGLQMGPPGPDIGGGVDLRDITLKDGRNAYSAYQDLAARPAPNARPLKELVANVMKTTAYKRAPDGDAGTRGTKVAMLTGAMAKYREAALRRIKADPNVREAMAEKQMAVRDHYKALAPSLSQPANRRPVGQELEAIGKKMGVDLSGLGKGQ